MIALELVTLQPPFDDWEDIQIMAEVPNGERPIIPNDCDPFLKDLIIECWQGDPSKRPQFLQILERLQSQKGESVWPIEFPNLLKLSTQFPYVGNIPKPASDIIIERMNLEDYPNDWQAFVSQRWPTFTSVEIKIKFKNKMQSVLLALDSEGERTTKLLDLLEKVLRKDILVTLNEYSRYLFL
jgi:hypothetical protein